MRIKTVLGAAGAACALALALAAALPSQAVAGGRRLMRFEAGTLQPVIAGAKTKKSTSYVLDYSVSNESGGAARPNVRLEVQTLDTRRTHGDAYDAAVFAAVGGGTAPSSTAQLRAAEMAAGAKASGLANFGAIDPNSDSFQVRVYGLFDPVYRDREGRVWSERRVLVLSYERTGDEFDRHLDEIRLTGTKEVVDGEPVLVREAHAK